MVKQGHRKAGLRAATMAATMAATLALTACGVSVEQEPSVEPAGAPAPSATGESTTSESAAGESAASQDTVDTVSATDPPTDGASGTAQTDTAGATNGPQEGPQAGAGSVPVLYAGPAADSPAVAALGELIQTPVESCLALYRDAVPDGAHLEPEPEVENTEGELALRCSMLAQSGTTLFVGDVRIMPQERDDQDVVVENSYESLQRGHLRSEIYPISPDYPENHLSTITAVLDRVGTVTPQPLVEPQAPTELAGDVPTGYTQPGHRSEEIIQLYRLMKDPYAGCQQLLDGALPEGASIDDDPMIEDSERQLTLWCTVETPEGLLFVSARSVVHPQTDTGMTPPLVAQDVGWQQGYVLMTAEVSGAPVDPAQLLPAMHANLRAGL